ncbi:non-canonical purine NTP pyrophosphatase [Candidatus Micrarchaeota archaeon]|nr:non-canonical purine NTP pyrophosphatase [Candidatus Micrarchaeota archaeon]MBU2476642.1 non-canonical purine NTP pyrophosphatase [Candidatus Micrarchaeota archaeon]
MELYFVTGNKHKVQEIQKVLGKKIQLIQKKLEIKEPALNSIEKIAKIKAVQAFKKIGKPLITEDTGIYFNAFKNFPGTEPKREFEKLDFKGLLEKLKGKKRNAFFITAICFVDAKGKRKTFSGKLHGRITEKVFYEKKDVLPYEKIFIPKGKKRVLAFYSRKTKNKFSHRAKAARKLKKFLGSKSINYRI